MTNKLSNKDKKDWQNFLDSSEKLHNKDLDQTTNQKISERSIDLHGYTLEEANIKITEFIENCYVNKVKKHEQNKNMLEVTVEFVSEIISCVKDKDDKVISGDPEKVKKVLDTWKFSKDSRSSNPNWLLIDTQA